MESSAGCLAASVVCADRVVTSAEWLSDCVGVAMYQDVEIGLPGSPGGHVVTVLHPGNLLGVGRALSCSPAEGVGEVTAHLAGNLAHGAVT